MHTRCIPHNHKCKPINNSITESCISFSSLSKLSTQLTIAGLLSANPVIALILNDSLPSRACSDHYRFGINALRSCQQIIRCVVSSSTCHGKWVDITFARELKQNALAVYVSPTCDVLLQSLQIARFCSQISRILITIQNCFWSPELEYLSACFI